jgi:hypothetical protein
MHLSNTIPFPYYIFYLRTPPKTVDGESMVKEEGFTLHKYEELFFNTMDTEVIEDWNHKLPDHPKLPPKPVKKKKRKQVKNISPSDDDDSSEGEGGGGSGEECYAVIGSSRACGKCFT